MFEENKQIARKFIEAFEAGDLATFERIVAPDIVDHNASPGTRSGLQGLLDAVAMFRTGFPDVKITIEQIIAEADLVAICGTVTGTNTGPLMGTPPTGKRATFPFMDTYRITNGKVVESWHVEDIAGMLGQLGLLRG